MPSDTEQHEHGDPQDFHYEESMVNAPTEPTPPPDREREAVLVRMWDGHYPHDFEEPGSRERAVASDIALLDAYRATLLAEVVDAIDRERGCEDVFHTVHDGDFPTWRYSRTGSLVQVTPLLAAVRALGEP